MCREKPIRLFSHRDVFEMPWMSRLGPARRKHKRLSDMAIALLLTGFLVYGNVTVMELVIDLICGEHEWLVNIFGNSCERRFIAINVDLDSVGF